MKSFLVCTALFLFLPSESFAAELSFEMGRYQQEQLVLQTFKAKQRTIFLMRHMKPNQVVFQRAIPKEIFYEIYNQGKAWGQKMSKGRTLAISITCTHRMMMSVDQKQNLICMDQMSIAERKKFFSWYNQQTHLAMPIIK